MSTAPTTGQPILVFDASALVSWLLQTNNQWRRIQKLIDSPAECVMSVPALTEAIYVARRRGNTSPPTQLSTALIGQGIRVEPATAIDAEWAGTAIAESELNPAKWTNSRGSHEGTLSLGDGLTLALAHRLNAHAVTFDEAWFRFPTLTFKLVSPWKIHP
jgi:uncharacterized protein with PIN domain